MASVIHQTAIHKVDAKTAFASSESPSELKNSFVKINNIGPKKRPIFFFFF